ncbi:SDR family oxidoreductase [Nocardioides antri]|uniref:SDR family oxidoreductase n=1 Tax=Nocardioides antri TaxID=2607659 RepID=A0A5B1M109_9ACTN|nr:SDR family oxidoreductase [Nocardioides antri]KAA1426444.1 SDR family oxidoreductase [Nocardioides antri]
MSALTDRVAIVTGASSGIGRATALLLAREGASVVVTARREEELDSLVSQIEGNGGRAVSVVGDIREEKVAEHLVDLAVERFGGLDIAFNNAGTNGEMAPVAGLTLEQWHDTVDTNLTSAFLGAKHQAPAMLARGGGSIIFTSTFVGHTVGMPGTAAYAASKAGLIGLTQALAVELADGGVRVNTIIPGGTDTPANVANAPGAPPQVRAFMSSLHALKRMAKPEEIAQAALYLASEASSFVTGTALRVDGGLSISRT